MLQTFPTLYNKMTENLSHFRNEDILKFLREAQWIVGNREPLTHQAQTEEALQSLWYKTDFQRSENSRRN